MAKLSRMSNTGILEFSGANTSGWVSNAKLLKSGSTIKIVGSDAADLSTDSPAWFHFNTGKNIKLTASPSFTDGSGSHIAGMEFGITNTRDWLEDRPMFIYATYDASDNGYVFCSFDPTKSTTPTTAAEIGYQSTPSSNNADTDIFVWTATNVTSTLQSRPCVLIGSMRAQWTATGTYWTITAIGNQDGIGKYQEDVEFNFPVGQMGADASRYFSIPSGTIPIWGSGIVAKYTISLTGWVNYIFVTDAATFSTAGTGSGAIKLHTPYKGSSSYYALPYLIVGGMYRLAALAPTYDIMTVVPRPDSYTPLAKANGNITLTGSSFTNVSDDITVDMTYKAF